jgi:hypothetical protein
VLEVSVHLVPQELKDLQDQQVLLDLRPKVLKEP